MKRLLMHGLVAVTSLSAATSLAAQVQPAVGLTVPTLHCQVRYASETVHVEAQPVASPYTVAAQDIGGRFRFKAVVVGQHGEVDYVALYAYDMSVPLAPVLIHEVVHKPPFSANPVVPGLTGWNHVYSAYLGREMVYGCAWAEKGTAP